MASMSVVKAELGDKPHASHGRHGSRITSSGDNYGDDKEEQSITGDPHDKTYPSKLVVLPVVGAICLAFFLFALDRTIVGVAIPAISNEFNSFGDISWYESAYLLPNAALLLPMGKIYTFFRAKWVYLALVIMFEIGSVVSASAPTSVAFIIGRAISGVGAAGATTGTQVILTDLLPLEERPKYQGFLGATFGLASIVGPLLGGVFATRTTWRWCFWINLPVGGLAIVLLILLLPNSPPPKPGTSKSLGARIKQFDPIGTALVTPGLVLLLLALQWGGNEGSYKTAKVVTTLVLAIVLLFAFAISQVFIGESGTLPPRIVRQRSILAAFIMSLGAGSALFIISFYLPVWYQAIKGLSAQAAGIRLLPYFVGTVVFVISSGIFVSKVGYYAPLAIIGTALLIVGCGLFTTFNTSTSSGKSIGYQIVFSAGMGLSLAQPNNAAQTVLGREDIALGITLINFGQFVGGTIFISACQGILSGTLKQQLRARLPGVDLSSISSSGATDLGKLILPNQLPIFLGAYNDGLDNVFKCALGVSSLAFVGACFLEWRSVKKQVDKQLA